MITVNGKTLEVGDTAVFRCGGKHEIVDTKYNDVYYKSCTTFRYSYNDDGTYLAGTSPFDIIDIIKAEKLEIIEYKDLYFDTYLPDGSCVGFNANVKYNLTNRKTISVEVAE